MFFVHKTAFLFFGEILFDIESLPFSNYQKDSRMGHLIKVSHHKIVYSYKQGTKNNNYTVCVCLEK